jgi:hypothetical protein
MASIDALTFDKPAYAPGDGVTLTVNYTPDTPGVVSQTFNVTVNVNAPDGTIVATQSTPLVVNTPQGGDTVSVSDDGGHAWSQASDNGSVAVFTTQV